MSEENIQPEECSYLDGQVLMKDYISEHVCSNFPERYKEGEKYYCIFHYPNKSKAENLRIAIEQKILRQHYVFYGTWFPIELDFANHQFENPVDFRFCRFSKEVSFERANFLLYAQFEFAIFKSRASFKSAIFTTLKNQESFPELENIILETNFYSVTFKNAVNFDFAKFNSKVNFTEARFLTAYNHKPSSLTKAYQTSFLDTQFYNEAIFEKTVFGNPRRKDKLNSIYLSGTIFEKTANFKSADFLSSVNFSSAVFKSTADFRETKVEQSISFENASFVGYGKFSSKDKNHRAWNSDGINFSSVEADKAEKISFHTLRLKPDSFINTDARKFEFTNIEWKIKSFAVDWSRFKDITFWKVDAKNRKSQYELLSIAYRRLAANAEENNRYAEASRLRFTANEIQRIGNHWYGRLPSLSWLYKWSSRYGENWLWALFILVVILTAFTFYYHFAYFYICPKNTGDKTECVVRAMTWGEAAHQSLMTAALQNIEYRKSITNGQDIMILFEKFLAPLQAALLALAIRRKFMR